MAEVDNDKLKRSKPGATAEKAENLANTGAAGLYRHPETGNELATKHDPLLGDAQSEAVMRLGFVRVSDVPEGYEKTMASPSEESSSVDSRKPASQGSVKGVEARLDKLESNNDALEAENARLREQLANGNSAGFPGQENVKRDAIAQVESGKASGEGEGSDSGTTSPDLEEEGDDEEEVKALSQQNSTELKETAAREGVEVTEELDTNAKLRQAIQANRDADGEEGNE